MREDLVRALRSQRPQIRQRWEALLHAEPVNTPLAHPGALIHLLDWTLEQIFDALANTPFPVQAGRPPKCADYRLQCACGRNPLLTYFVAGDQAMREALVLAQAAAPSFDPVERDVSLQELDSVFRHLARREIESFCGVCQYRDGGQTVTSSDASTRTPHS